jgi:hypothetical protein
VQRQDGSKITAVHTRKALDRGRVNIPHITGDRVDRSEAARVRRMETVIHIGAQAQRRINTARVVSGEGGIADQLVQRVGQPLGLDKPTLGDLARRHQLPVARRNQGITITTDRPRARLELAGKTVLERPKIAPAGLIKTQITREELQYSNAGMDHQRMAAAAEPADETRKPTPCWPVRDHDVYALGPIQNRPAVPLQSQHPRGIWIAPA